MSCGICEKRPPKRFCPAKGETICAVCCGEQREVSIDCPLDCSYLITAHRYEAEHRKPISSDDFPYRGTDVPADFMYAHWPVIAGIATTIRGAYTQNTELNDAAIFAALEALAETYRTLGTGIYYERPPDAPGARALYGQIAEFLQNFRKQETQRTGNSSLKDADIFRVFVFLLRVAKQETNGRPRSRAFLGFLRSRFPLPASEPAENVSRIIMP